MKNTRSIAAGGLLTAFAVAVMLVSNLMPSGMYTFPAVSGIIVYVLSFAAGRPYSWASFAVVSIISFLFCADKEAPLCFVLFFGYYPLLKELIEKIRFRPAEYIVKLLVFNAAGAGIWLLLVFVFSVPFDEFSVFGVRLPAVIISALNLVFILYDLALTMFFRRYGKKINEFVTKINKR